MSDLHAAAERGPLLRVGVDFIHNRPHACRLELRRRRLANGGFVLARMHRGWGYWVRKSRQELLPPSKQERTCHEKNGQSDFRVENPLDI